MPTANLIQLCLSACVFVLIYRCSRLQLVSVAHVISSARLRFSMCIHTNTHITTRLTTHFSTDSLIISGSPCPMSSPSSCPNLTVKQNHKNQNNELQLYNIILYNLDCINFHINCWFMWFCNNVQLNWRS